MKKYFEVSIDMKYSHEVRVIANTKTEAKKKAIEKFIKKLKASDFNIDVEQKD